MRDTSILEGNAVTVDGGDLSEVCQAAEAWASQLRHRAGDRGNTANDVQQYIAAADRIDQAAHRLRAQSHESGMARS